MGAITLNAIEKWYGDVQVIKGVDLEIEKGEFIIFVGPSGCGKCSSPTRSTRICRCATIWAFRC